MKHILLSLLLLFIAAAAHAMGSAPIDTAQEALGIGIKLYCKSPKAVREGIRNEVNAKAEPNGLIIVCADDDGAAEGAAAEKD